MTFLSQKTWWLFNKERTFLDAVNAVDSEDHNHSQKRTRGMNESTSSLSLELYLSVSAIQPKGTKDKQFQMLRHTVV